MKKNFKKALIVAPAACLALSLGMFAAACTPEDPGEAPHEHSYTAWSYDDDKHWKYCPDCPDNATTDKTLHTFDTNDECECGASTKTEVIDVGGAPFTVNGATGVAFIKDFGTYEMSVDGLTDTEKEYKITVGGKEYTVNAENDTFVFNVNPEDKVRVYNPDATSMAKAFDASGVRMVITPKADYSNGETPDVFSYTINPVSVTLKNGFNEGLFVGAPVIHKYFVSASGDYTFSFDVADGNGYTVELAGEKYTLTASNNTFTVGLKSSSDAYAFTVTPAEGNTADEVTAYVAQPKKDYSAAYGDTFLLSSSNYPDLVYLYNGEVDVEFNVSKGNAPFALVGETYYHNFSVFVGEDEVGVYNDADPSGEKTNVNLTLNLREDHIVDGKVVLTFKFKVTKPDGEKSDDGIYLSAALTEPAQAVDNSVLTLVNSTDSSDVTVCAAADEAEGKFTYTFTAPEDGWYAVNLYSPTQGVNYSVNGKTGVTTMEWVVEAVELQKDDVLTVVLTEGTYQKPKFDDKLNFLGYEEVTATPVDTIIAVTETEAPKQIVIDATNQLVVGNIKIEFEAGTSYNGVVYGFTSAEGGSYTMSVVQPAANGQEVVFAADKDGNVNFNAVYIGEAQFGYQSSYSFTLAAGETKYFAFGDNWGDDNGYIICIEESVSVISVVEGDVLTKPGDYEVTVNANLMGPTPINCTFKPETAGTYKITSHDDSMYFTVKVDEEDVIYYNMSADDYVSEGTFEVTSAGVAFVLSTDSYSGGTYEFTIEKV